VLNNAALNVNVLWWHIEIIHLVSRSSPNRFLSGRNFLLYFPKNEER